jgi:hypothetical protein
MNTKIRKHLFHIVLVVVLVCAPAFAQTSLPSKFESWNEVQLIVPLVRDKDENGKTIDRLTATFSGILRLGRSGPDVVDARTGVALDYRVSKYVTLNSAVLYRRDENVKDVSRYETRLDFGITLSKSLKNFTFRNRNMYEHRFRNNRGDTDLYRNRIQVSYPIRHNDKELFTPFISEEGYYNLTDKNWAQNEFLAGISRKLNQRTTVDVAYIRNDTRPTNVNGLSITLKIKLR